MNYKIMTFNLWCGGVTPERVTRVFETIRGGAPDILGVQEATPQWMGILTEGLPEYAHAGIGREGGDNGDYNAIFVKKERFEILEESTRWITDTPEVFSYVEGCLCPRIYTCVRLRDLTDDSIVYHVNTHLDHGKEEVRMIQAHYLYAFVESLDAPVTVTGDFNYEETTSEVYRYFTSGILADSKYLAKCAYKVPTFHGYNGQHGIIDYCYLTRSAFDVEDYRVLDKPVNGALPSDHNPVLVTVSKRA